MLGLEGSGVVADEEPVEAEDDDEKPGTSAPRSEGVFEDEADEADCDNIIKSGIGYGVETSVVPSQERKGK